jgi:8-oxo-dGTP pyrophosphatase MutT (NUDIX family)/phosphohistidine phosphatase SixA
MPDQAVRAMGEEARAVGEEIRAAGAVVWRPSGTGLEVALIHRRRYDDWSFPKGKCEPGEHVLATAVREVAEETGERVILGRPLGTSHYDSNGQRKRVHYWAGRRQEPAAAFVANSEVDAVEWRPVPAARGRLTYQRDVQTLDEFAGGPAETVPCILLRHAAAGSRAGWHANELARPLDRAGAEIADALAHLLACFGPARVISSPAERCVATVRPYAVLTGAKIELEPLFTAEQPGAGHAVADRVAAIVGDGRPVVICAHRENLPQLLEAACAALGSAPPQGPVLGKGGFWVLHSADGTMASAERHHPLDPAERLDPLGPAERHHPVGPARK